jgi:hypothetical protein
MAVFILNMAKFRIMKDCYVKQIVPTFVLSAFYNKHVWKTVVGTWCNVNSLHKSSTYPKI